MIKKRLSIFFSLAIAYILLCITLYFQQQRLFFFPTRQLKNTPSSYQLDYENVWLPVTKTEKIHGWWIPAKKSDAPVMLYFHHNAVNIGANITQAKQFQELGYSIFLFDYRGFGNSEGSFPTESQVYEDARIAWDYLTKKRHIPEHKIIIYGHSIGGAVAIDLATKHPDAAALIVQSSFTSMSDMTKRLGLYWLIPTKLVLKQRFESLEKIKSVKMPVLIITGTKDIQIPVEMGKSLYKAATESKQLLIIEGQGHDNHLSDRHKQRVQKFIERATNNRDC